MTKVKRIVYSKIIGKRSTWYVPVNTDNPIKNLHVARKMDKNGYAGRDMRFLLTDGTEDVVKGPYCLEDYGPRDFEEDTGILLADYIVQYLVLEEQDAETIDRISSNT